MKRRQLLQAVGIGATAAALPAVPLMAGDAQFSTTAVADAVILLRGAGANVVVIGGADGVVLVDGGLRAHTEALLERISRETGNGPVEALFNTNWRPEHTGLNHVLGPAGVDIMGHEFTRLWQTNSFTVDWEGERRYEPMPETARINRSFRKPGSLAVGGVDIEYAHLPQAHTDGDIYLRLPDRNILIVGDLVAGEGLPVMDWETGGWIGGLLEATEALLAMSDEQTRFLPAVGPVVDRAHVQAQAELLDRSKQAVGDAYRSGLSLADWKQQNPAAELGIEGQAGADLYIAQLYDSAWSHIRELGGMV